MDAVRTLFEMFRDGGTDYLEQVVAEEMPESLHLDFKLLSRGAAPLTKEDRRTLATALSGFANADGGVIVWGVDCRSHGQFDPDTAKELKPIHGLRLLQSDLNSHSAQLVSPGIVGVQHALIAEASEPDTGFAVSYIPRSEQDLHMAVGSDQHRYYYRTTASFLPMEAYMVADRYGRRPRPHLQVELEFSDSQHTINAAAIELIYRVSIRNIGKGMALYPAVTFTGPSVYPWRYGIDGNTRTGLPQRPRVQRGGDDQTIVFAGGADDAIHPDTMLHVTHIACQIGRGTKVLDDIVVRFGVYCDGFSEQGEFRITPEEVVMRRGF